MDVLQEVPLDQLPALRRLYEVDWPRHVQVYNFLGCFIESKSKAPKDDSQRIFSPDGNWEEDGAFVAIIRYENNDLYVSTLEDSAERLMRAVKETRVIQWDQKPVFFACLDQRLIEPMRLARAGKAGISIPGDVWWLPKEEAASFRPELPPGTQFAPLDVSRHLQTIYEVWPHRAQSSPGYLGQLLERFGGVGLFREEDGLLVAWVMQNYHRGLGMLQTREGHERKGYASFVAKEFSRKLAEDGYDAIGFVVSKNEPSRKMFAKMGFRQATPITWLEA